MKTYIRSMDFLLLATAQYREGNVKTAGQLFVKAMAQKDIEATMCILETNNKAAFNIQASAAKVKLEKKVPVSAAKRLQADLDAAPEGDEADSSEENVDPDISSLINGAGEFGDEGGQEGEAETAEDEDNEPAGEVEDEEAPEPAPMAAKVKAKVKPVVAAKGKSVDKKVQATKTTVARNFERLLAGMVTKRDSK